MTDEKSNTNKILLIFFIFGAKEPRFMKSGFEYIVGSFNCQYSSFIASPLYPNVY